MSDLVERLRAEAEGMPTDYIKHQAADEIEQLRIERDATADLAIKEQADNERLRAENDAWQNQDLLEQSNRQADEIERLTNEVSYLRTREKNHQNYIAGLEGDLEVMRLQRDATQVSRCSNCERLRADADFIIRGLLHGPHTNEAKRLGERFIAALKGVESNE